MKKYYKDMDIARGIGIFLVVLGHAFPDAQFNNNPFYSYIFKFIYSFHMPFFFVISGFFAYKIYSIESISDYGKFIYSKFKRLMIPYFAVSLIAIPIKLYMNKYAVRPMSANGLIRNILVYPLDIPIQYFWFIYTLFFLFAVAPLFKKLPIKVTLFITLILNLIPIKQIELFYASGVIHYLFYFFFGIYLYTAYDEYKNIKNKFGMVIILSIILIVLNLFNVTRAAYPYYNLATALTGTMLFINLAQLLVNNNVGEAFKFIGGYSYDIYLFSWFFQTGARVVLFQMMGLDYNISTLIMLIVGFMPILLSRWFFNKVPALSKVFLGHR